MSANRDEAATLVQRVAVLAEAMRGQQAVMVKYTATDTNTGRVVAKSTFEPREGGDGIRRWHQTRPAHNI